jgi:predicted amidohydrolase YtcJ
MVLRDMAAHGIIAVTNPVFNWQEGAAFVTNLGEARMARTQPFRSYMKGGVVMASGSDYPVTSHDPWIGMYALLTRKDQTTGQVYGPEETVGIEDALRSYTINGAYLTYDEKSRGSLEVGKLADLVVLDLADIYELERNPELCLRMAEQVVMTVVEGELRYQKQPPTRP